jgi:pimeloyl-ACP methyl ester carboxylesterase
MWFFLIISSICLNGPLLAAEVVELEVAPQVIATASYHQGDEDKPAILLLHGWLQTREFSTIARLFDTLSGAGYTLLAPTLTLGVSQRSQSLPCESIHTNAIDDDIAEIGRWLSWLSDRQKQPVILIGHSMGATELVAFLEQYHGAQVARSILISIGPIGPGWAENFANEEDRKRAENSIATGDKWVADYGLAYCKKYVTTAHSLLSFYRWDYQQLSSALANMIIPTRIIIGGADNLIDSNLIQQLASENIQVDVLEGAGHFFDKEYEFDLHDTVESLLSDNS